MELSDRAYRGVVVAVLLSVLLFALQQLELVQSPFFAYAISGAFLIHVTFAPRRFELTAVLFLAPILAWSYHELGGHFADSSSAPATVAAFLGVASLPVLGWRAVRKDEALREFLVALCMPMFTIGTGTVLLLLVPLQSRVYDFVLYRVDATFGGQASGVVARSFDAVPILGFICILAYHALPLVQVFLLATVLRARLSLAQPLVAFMLAGIAGCSTYLFVPAIGPRNTFGAGFAYKTFSFVPLSTTKMPFATPGNAVPSLHLAWALLILWNIPQRWRFGRVAAAAFLVLTIMATLGTGQHYLIDLVVAVPFAVCVQNLACRRWRFAVIAGALTMLWLVYFRFGFSYLEPRPICSWIAGLASVLLPFLPGFLPTVGSNEAIASECILSSKYKVDESGMALEPSV